MVLAVRRTDRSFARGLSTTSAISQFLAFSLLFAAFCMLILQPAVAQSEANVVEGRYIVKFKKSVGISSRSRIHARLNVANVRNLHLVDAELVESQPGVKIDDAYAKELLASGLVEYIEPEQIYTIDATPNDSRFSELWGMHNSGQTGGTDNIDIDAPEAWELATGSNDVVVGVVDTGVDYQHPDLAANMWTNSGEIANNGIDDDGNGVVDDVHGYNAASDSGDPLDDNGHGTHCAGTIGGAGNNGAGVAGVNWNVKIMGLKFLSAGGSGTTSDAISAIDYAVTMKNRGVNVKVLSNSWGGGGYSQSLKDAIVAANNAGILFVAAAGNSANDIDSTPSYPAGYEVDNIVSVAALDHDGNLASFSNYGAASVDLGAPGVSIVSTYLDGTYRSLSGTSMATPHVSGVAGLVAGYDPSLSVAQLKARLIGTVKPLASLTGLMVNPGMLSALNALTDEIAPAPPTQPLQSYFKSQAAYSFDSALGTKVLEVDDGYYLASLGFPFTYYGDDYTHLIVSANGRVEPANADTPLPSSADYSNSLRSGIMAFHDDLYPASSSLAGDLGGVWFNSNGNVATVTWYSVNYGRRNSTDSDSLLVIQAKLYASGKIEFQYQDAVTGSSTYDNAASATVGLAPSSSGRGVKLQVSHNTSNPADVDSGKALSFRNSQKAERDFDGDGKSDIIIWRPLSGNWFILKSSTGFDFEQHAFYQLGLPGDVPVAADFDGDTKLDLAVWRPTDGNWFFRLSTIDYSAITMTQWGLPGDKPQPGDYDGDGKADLAVFRPSTGVWYVLRSASNFNRSEALRGNSEAVMIFALGDASHDPVPADYNNDGNTDFGVVSQLSKFWTAVDLSGQTLLAAPWGVAGDTALACPWTGESASRVVIRPENGSLTWYIVNSDGSVDLFSWGLQGDVPSCILDTDGDGLPEAAVWRPTDGMWYLRHSDGRVTVAQFGLNGDMPL